MYKKLTIFATLVLISFGLLGCPAPSDRVPDRVPFSDGLKKTMGEVKARAALLINEEGQIIATDDQGKVLDRCSVKPVEKGDIQQCRGLQKGATIEDINSVMVIRSKINPTCLTIPDARGYAYQYCW